MIKFDKKLEHDFLNRDWIKILKAHNVPMEDAKYFIVRIDGTDYITTKSEFSGFIGDSEPIPTYSTAELMYKIPEWHPKHGKIIYGKDASFYMFGFKNDPDNDCISEHPIESLAELLVRCMKDKTGCVNDISDK